MSVRRRAIRDRLVREAKYKESFERQKRMLNRILDLCKAKMEAKETHISVEELSKAMLEEMGEVK